MIKIPSLRFLHLLSDFARTLDGVLSERYAKKIHVKKLIDRPGDSHCNNLNCQFELPKKAFKLIKNSKKCSRDVFGSFCRLKNDSVVTMNFTNA